MIFADKLIQLRKKAGWSQEELAERMNVTRQSISKWEGAQSVPELEKIIQLSNLFDVSTDYLLKDEMEDVQLNIVRKDLITSKKVSIEEAKSFLSIKRKTSKMMALATFLCIISPICLLILAEVSENSKHDLKENVAVGIGMITLLILVAIAVALFILSGRKTAKYDYLEKEIFETDNEVIEMVLNYKEKYSKTYTKSNIIGTMLCILALIPLFIGMIVNDENILLETLMLSTLLIFVGIGVVFFIKSGIIWASFEKLLQEGDYSKEKKKNQSIATAISVFYWLIVTAIFLGYSLSTNNWEYSWIIWVIAGVIYPAIVLITNFIGKRK